MNDEQVISRFRQLPDVETPEALRNAVLIEARVFRPEPVQRWWTRCKLYGAPAAVCAMLLVGGLALVMPWGLSGPSRVATDTIKGYPMGGSPAHDILEGHLGTKSIQKVMVANDPAMVPPQWNSRQLREEYVQRTQALLQADADRLLMRGRRYKALGRIDLALKDFETIYRFYPEYAYVSDALIYRSQCYAFLGDNDKAIASLKLVIEKFPAKKEAIQPMINQLRN